MSNTTFPAPVLADSIGNLVPGDYMHLNSQLLRIEEVQVIPTTPFTVHEELRNIRFERSGELAFIRCRSADVVLCVKGKESNNENRQ